MKKDDTVFLKHILDAINLIEEYPKDKSYESLRIIACFKMLL